MRLMELMRLESLKQRKRINFLFLLAGALSIIAWVWGMADRYTDNWGFLIYECILENSTSFPIIIAIFASRQMDLEHRGDTWKMLYTFASPYEIFFAKIIRGTVQIFMAVILQAAAILAVGMYFKYTAQIPVLHFLWMSLCNFLIMEILFLIHSILSFFTANQAVSVCLGLAGFFISLFLAFVEPGNIQRLIPWGLFGNTLSVHMDWHRKTRVVKFIYTDFPLTDLLACVVWLISLIAVSCFLLKRGNTDENILQFPGTGNTAYKGHEKILLPTEFLKMRQLPPYLALLFLPIVSAVMGTFNYLSNLSILTDRWYSLWSQHTLFLNYLFMPAVISIFTSGILHVEHTGTNWNQLLVNASAHKIVIQKLLAALLFNFAAIIWTAVLYIICGKYFCKFTEMPPSDLAEWIACGLLGAACISAFQFLISLIIRNYAAAIGISFLGAISGLTITAYYKMPYIMPYSLLSVGMRSNNPNYVLNYKAFFTSCVVQLVLWITLSIIYINNTDVKTHG